ncbi:hypothetical protein [Photorhabdus caribbeanensis]|uniref:hypothetical protein n=1 Tax=Photorhabdus caribbeanensis TaxID=1004165 RepID=UPI001BD45A0B|nr:hypothetical protein [Photorhabdus caribbeanensis]
MGRFADSGIQFVSDAGAVGESGAELHEEVMYVYFHQMIGDADQILCRRVSSA